MHTRQIQVEFFEEKVPGSKFGEKVPGKVIHTHNTYLTVKMPELPESNYGYWTSGDIYSHAQLAEFRK